LSPLLNPAAGGLGTAVRGEAASSQTPGSPLRMHWPATVASFRTWRGSRDYIAWDPEPDNSILTFTLALDPRPHLS